MVEKGKEKVGSLEGGGAHMQLLLYAAAGLCTWKEYKV